jgi:hypothetical protein
MVMKTPRIREEAGHSGQIAAAKAEETKVAAAKEVTDWLDSKERRRVRSCIRRKA